MDSEQIIDTTQATDAIPDATPPPEVPFTPPVPLDARARQRRIAELIRDREVLNREIAWLSLDLGENGRPWWTCQRCGYRWQSQRADAPKICARCHSSSWGTPRRRATRIAKPGTEGYDPNYIPKVRKRRSASDKKAERDAELKALNEEFVRRYGHPPKEDVAAPTANPLVDLPPLPPPPALTVIDVVPLLDTPLDGDPDGIIARRMPGDPLPDDEEPPIDIAAADTHDDGLTDE